MDLSWIARYLGVSFIRNIALPSIGKASMKLSGIEFFTNRHELYLQHFDNRLSAIKTIDAIVVIGRTLHEDKLASIRKFRRVIFPHPNSESILDYGKTVNEHGHIERNIVEATTSLLSEGIKVRWYPHAIHHAILIADPELGTGWVQVECVLPFSVKNLRPAWRACRKQHEQLVMSMKEVFDKMWDKSVEPDKEVTNS